MSSSSSLELHSIDGDDAFFDYVDPASFSPQLVAVLRNDVPLLQSLLQEGKSPNVNDNKGFTLLHHAVEQQKKEVFDFLLSLEDIRLDATNFANDTPLLISTAQENNYFAIKLIEKGADVNCKNAMLDTPLHNVKGGLVAQHLLNYGALIDVQNVFRETPLFKACVLEHDEVIGVLMVNGADATIISDDGRIPFSVSSETMQNLLFEYTFDIFSKIHFNMFSNLMGYSDVFKFYYQLLEIAQKRKTLDWSGFGRSLPPCHTELIGIQYDSYETDDQLMEPLCLFLSFGQEISSTDVDLIYEIYGFSTLLKLLLHMKINFLPPTFDSMSDLIYRIDLQFDHPDVLQEILSKNDTILQFFSLPFRNETENEDNNYTVKIPSLIELSRNCFRKFFIHKFKIKNNAQFFTLLNRLNVPEICKQIVSFEKPLYIC